MDFFSGPYFPVFGLNMGKYKPRKTPHLDIFAQCIIIYIIDQLKRIVLLLPGESRKTFSFKLDLQFSFYNIQQKKISINIIKAVESSNTNVHLKYIQGASHSQLATLTQNIRALTIFSPEAFLTNKKTHYTRMHTFTHLYAYEYVIKVGTVGKNLRL